jgi:hypothetical protein
MNRILTIQDTAQNIEHIRMFILENSLSVHFNVEDDSTIVISTTGDISDVLSQILSYQRSLYTISV